MLKDITIGQHFPGDSPVHRLDARFKIVLTILFLVMLFIGTNPLGLLLAALFLIAAYALAKIPARLVWRSIKPIIPIIIFTLVLNLLFTKGENPFFTFWIISLSVDSLIFAITMAVRVVLLIISTSLLTYSTSPIVLTDAIEGLLSPLKIFHFPAHELAMMMTIALRFIPTIITETDKIMSAQKARGAELDSGPITRRIKALIPILVPLFLSAFRRADELATAMECRCYRGGEGRTRLRSLKTKSSDIFISVFCVLFFVLIAFSGNMYTAILGLF